MLLIITRVAGLNDDKRLLTAWSVKPKQGPWHFDKGGSQVLAVPGDQEGVVVVQGDPDNALGNRIAAALPPKTSAADLCLLVHPGGGGQTARGWIEGTWGNGDSMRGVICAHVFSTQAAGAAVRKTLLELGLYAQGRNRSHFEALLKYILDHCCGCDDLDNLIKTDLNGNPERRKNLKIPPRPPTAEPADPIATIIHDVVSYFDAFLLDLQTAEQDPAYWSQKLQESSNRRIELALERLRFLACGAPSKENEAEKWASARGLPFSANDHDENRKCVVLKRRASEYRLESELGNLQNHISSENTEKLTKATSATNPSRSEYLDVKKWLEELERLLEVFRRGDSGHVAGKSAAE